MSTVAVCDTQPIAIEGLRSLLESAESLRVVAAENTVMDGIGAVRELRPSILLVDKAFGYQAVSDWLAMLRSSPVPVATIVWGSSFSEVEAMRFIQAGASGVLRKTASLDTVLECLRTVERGNTWMSGDMVRDLDRLPHPAHSPLTARELQVMEAVERGCKNKHIAAELGIQIGTVKIHLKHIFEKTGIRGRYGLALSGLKEKGLLSMSAGQ
ncbi:Response regulator receiver protein (modular protein) [Candidatus Sulfopaludibacter sp. SbA3]|nr:Response regulator receiver protein (modular protein) [Candidatus Sulfopaludibacter sp. SbA3]